MNIFQKKMTSNILGSPSYFNLWLLCSNLCLLLCLFPLCMHDSLTVCKSRTWISCDPPLFFLDKTFKFFFYHSMSAKLETCALSWAIASPAFSIAFSKSLFFYWGFFFFQIHYIIFFTYWGLLGVSWTLTCYLVGGVISRALLGFVMIQALFLYSKERDQLKFIHHEVIEQ